MEKTKVLILFGGQSAEHEVSVVSARSVCEALDRNRYMPILVGIARDGDWFYDGPNDRLLSAKIVDGRSESVVRLGGNAGELVNRHGVVLQDGSFDVVVPGSGGKDSGFVAHQLKYRFDMHPLCVTWAPFGWTKIGWKNLQNFVGSGFNNIIGQPDQIIHQKLSRLSFELIGDAWQPFTFGQKAWAFHMANKFNIKLIFYGENGELEYGGSTDYKYKPKEDPEVWEKHHFRGAAVDKLADV